MKYASEYYGSLNNLANTNSNMNRLCKDIERWCKQHKYSVNMKGFDYTIMIDESIPYLKCRHIFVHSDGKPNDEFKEKYPDIRLDSKGRIALDMEFLNAAYQSVNDLLKAYDAEMISNHYISQTELVG